MWLDKLEKRFGNYAIPRLINIIICGNICVWFFLGTQRDALQRLMLDRRLVASGEIWRLVTHLLVPPTQSVIWLFFFLYLLWIYGNALEREWGAFRFNVFYFSGAVLTTIGGLLFQGGQGTLGGVYLSATVFFAFATLFPNFELLLFFILPVKIKWLALLSAGIFAVQFIEGTGAVRAVILLSLGNYLLFFGRPFLETFTYRRRREQFRSSMASTTSGAFHRCASCDRTEKDDNELEFRVCTDCEGGREYCLEHLNTHEHV